MDVIILDLNVKLRNTVWFTLVIVLIFQEGQIKSLIGNGVLYFFYMTKSVAFLLAGSLLKAFLELKQIPEGSPL
jgi:hypothetical protein